jgi:hypothetical protein
MSDSSPTQRTQRLTQLLASLPDLQAGFSLPLTLGASSLLHESEVNIKFKDRQGFQKYCSQRAQQYGFGRFRKP